MRHIFLANLILVALATTATAQTPPPAPAQSVQQQFDEATSALAAGQWGDAVQRFEALQARSRHPRSLAVIRIRLAVAYLELGRIEDARRSAEQGLAALPADDQSLVADRFEALTLLGRVAEAWLDYPAAAERYRAAAALPIDEQDKLIAYRGLVQVQLFDQPEAAVRAAESALAVVMAGAERSRHLEGQFRTLKGRALLNLRRFAEARRELEASMRLLGNLTLRVDRADLLARSDLALAALLTGDQEGARRYLAYTGQGRFERGYVPTGNHFLPACGDRLRPDDVAVVEFSIGSDGLIGHVMPIYASRGGTVALDFAQAVRHWRFEQEAVSQIPPLLRSAVRVELRCTQARYRQPHLEIPDIARFVRERPLRPLSELRAALAEAERGNAPLATVRALIALADHPATGKTEEQALFRRALALATASNLDGRLIAGLAIRAADRPMMEPRDGRAELETLAASEPLHSHPAAAAAIRLVRASALYASGDFAPALQAAGSIAALPEVRAHSVLAEEAAGLLAALRALQAQPEAPMALCAIAPHLRRTTASSADFPRDVYYWGFEGWASIEPTVTPEGTVGGTRTLIAYPPFVFGDSAARVARRGRYDRSSRTVSCPADRVTVRFLMP